MQPKKPSATENDGAIERGGGGGRGWDFRNSKYIFLNNFRKQEDL